MRSCAPATPLAAVFFFGPTRGFARAQVTKYLLAKAHTAVTVLHPQAAPKGSDSLHKSLQTVTQHKK
jgi:hypothetical protein